MFCDLVGSTSISAKLDAEDWRDLVGGYLDAASAAVTQMGGHVAKKLGDGIMALFGYPIAQENDAERALRAALAIQRALTEHQRQQSRLRPPELAARIGVETGAVVVDSAGEVFGDAPNVAARVQALGRARNGLDDGEGAAPGRRTVRRRGSRRACAEGRARADDALPDRARERRRPALRAAGADAAGRPRRGSSRCCCGAGSARAQGEGQFLQIVGEPGLGKSRLIEEFRARLVDTPHTWVEWSSSQLLQNTPLHPIADWGRQRFGGADVPAERRLADLETSLQHDQARPGRICPAVGAAGRHSAAARTAPRNSRRRNCGAGSWRRCSPG